MKDRVSSKIQSIKFFVLLTKLKSCYCLHISTNIYLHLHIYTHNSKRETLRPFDENLHWNNQNSVSRSNCLSVCWLSVCLCVYVSLSLSFSFPLSLSFSLILWSKRGHVNFEWPGLASSWRKGHNTISIYRKFLKFYQMNCIIHLLVSIMLEFAKGQAAHVCM